ncbi:MAG: VCBS repeat-containing protein [Deltaproteobacteria bacterium]|nr:VCBS repeat-containing protein [Deltaproteobacteria bacterium]
MGARHVSGFAVLGLLLPGAAIANPPIFAAGTPILSLAAAPRAVTAADIDGDGDDDLVLCGAAGLSWVENTGAAWVEHAITAQTALGECSAVVTARFDRDGAVDVGFVGPTEAGVLYNDQAGTSWSFTRVSDTYVGATRVAAYDVRLDGWPDFFALVEKSLIDFHDNEGERGAFTKATADPITLALHDAILDVVDLDGDRFPEVLTDNPIGLGFEVYSRTPGGWSTSSVTGPFVSDELVSGDIDGDGDADVALVGLIGISWSENVNGTLSDAVPSFAPATSLLIALADVDQDGGADILHVDADNGLRLLALHGGEWDVRTLGAAQTPAPSALVAADLDQDGDLDVVVAGDGGLYLHANVTVHAASDTTRSVDLPGTYTAPDFVVAGDFDGDGDQDLAVASDSSASTRLLTWKDGVWSQAGVLASVRLHGEGVAVDFDADGDIDVLGATDSGIALLRNDGAIPWPGSSHDVASGLDIAVGDLDGDGDPDVMTGSRDSGALAWVESLDWGSDLATHSIDASWSGFDELAMADVDGDGALDLVVAQFDGESDEVAWYRNGGDGSSWERHLIAAVEGPAAVTAGDIDRDGVVEVVVATAAAGIQVLGPIVDPAAEWQVEVDWPLGGARVALGGLVNIDYDGRPDWTAPHSLFMSWMDLHGDVFESGLTTSSTDVAASAVADLDHDGDLDLVAAVQGQDRIAIWFNDRESAALSAVSLQQQSWPRAAPDTIYEGAQFFIDHLGVPADLDLELRSCTLSGTLAGVPLSADELMSWLEVTLYFDANHSLTHQAGEPALETSAGVEGGEYRFSLQPGALVLEPGEDRFYFVGVALTSAAFADVPSAELALTWGADCAVQTAGHEDGAITRIGLGGTVTMRFGVGNRLLQPGALSGEVASGESVTLDALQGSTDPDGDPISLVGVIAPPSHGEVTAHPDGTLTYASADDGATEDVFIYALTDGIQQVWAAGDVTILVSSQAPFAVGGEASTVEDRPLTIALEGGDGDDEPTFIVTQAAAHGSVELLDAEAGLVVYTPEANYVGSDSFTFQVVAGGETSAAATIALTVTATDEDDDDGDGLPDWYDNCRDEPNPQQRDLDQDGAGDACDLDDDGDDVPDDEDDCPRVPDPAQANHDTDALGDACDDDDDNDGVHDRIDGCPWDSDPGQEDLDGDGWGDACDEDDDGDGVPDEADNCPGVPNRGQANHDDDGLGDACDDDDDGDGVADADDLCPTTPDASSLDSDQDGVGDACDEDRDGDGTPGDVDCDDDDALVAFEQTFHADEDGDGFGVAADPLVQCAALAPEGYAEVAGDNCPSTFNPDQADQDGDGQGDACQGLNPQFAVDGASGDGDRQGAGAQRSPGAAPQGEPGAADDSAPPSEAGPAAHPAQRGVSAGAATGGCSGGGAVPWDQGLLWAMTLGGLAAALRRRRSGPIARLR